MNDENTRSPEADVRAVDIVVPVRRDAQAARRCIASILASRNDVPYAVIAVVDPDVEREFTAAAADILRDARVAQLSPGRFVDYSVAINRALAAHVDRDIVLLRADAEVHDDWLDRLALHAGTGGVGVIGTFTNVGGIATYPRAGEANRLPEGMTPASLDALFARANRGQSVKMKAIFGPCLYMTRACVSAIEDLHAVAIDAGDGSNIGLSIRAAKAGFRSLIAGDTFVASGGEGSRGGNDGDDPTRTFARRIDLVRLAASPRPTIVFVSHGWGGGIRRYMNDLAVLAQDRADVLYLEPANGDTVKLHWPRAGEAFAAWYRLPADLPALADTLRAIVVARLHFHHVRGLPRSILELPRATGIAYDCTLHDYFAICPQYHLTDEHGRYCGEPDAAGCAACLAQRPAQWDLDIGAWRSIFGEFLRGAARVIAPSQDVATRMHLYFPALPIDVWSHPEITPVPPRSVIRVVTLGSLSPEKGLRVVAACAEDARVRGLPLTFRVLGATTEPIAQSPDVSLTIHGSYADDHLPQLLAAERADVLFFPAQWPETYSYTLSVALSTGTPIVAAAIGAFTERLAGRAHVRMLPYDADAVQWNAALLDVARQASLESTSPAAKGVVSLRAAS